MRPLKNIFNKRNGQEISTIDNLIPKKRLDPSTRLQLENTRDYCIATGSEYYPFMIEHLSSHKAVKRHITGKAREDLPPSQFSHIHTGGIEDLLGIGGIICFQGQKDAFSDLVYHGSEIMEGTIIDVFIEHLNHEYMKNNHLNKPIHYLVGWNTNPYSSTNLLGLKEISETIRLNPEIPYLHVVYDPRHNRFAWYGFRKTPKSDQEQAGRLLP